MTESSEGRIERLKKMLYRQSGDAAREERSALHIHEEGASDSWKEDAPSVGAEATVAPRTPMLFWKKFFIVSVGFFIIAVIIALLVFFGNTNIVSTRNVDISISGPVAAPAGEETQLELVIENKNSVSLESVDLLVEYPEGARSLEDMQKELTRFRKNIPAIKPGESVKEPLRAVLFGQEGDEKTFKITLEYRVQDSNAIFAKEKEFTTRISSSATSISVDAFSEVVAGQEFAIEVIASSNTDTITRDLLLSVEYPFGFAYISAEPRPSADNNVWTIGDLAAGGKRTIKIRGVLEGQDGEEKIFRISLGSRAALGENKLGVVYNSSVANMRIARPFLSVLMFVNGAAAPEYIAESGETIDVGIVWTNNLPTKIVDAKIEAKLDGAAIDARSVEPRNGFYNSSDNTIIWDKNSLPELATIESGAGGRTNLKFSFKSLFLQNGSLLRSPSASVVITTSGKRVSETGVQESIAGKVEQKIKISSEVVFTPVAAHFIGPIQNTGAMPPQVGKETTYTIAWTAVNSSNHISRGAVKTVLPPYVRFTGAYAPSGENLTFNSSSREVIWSMDRLEAGSGITLPPREVSFQVGFTPSISQLNQSPIITGESVFSGVDEFTGAALRRTGKPLTISLNTDPHFVFSQGMVVESPE